MTGWIWPWLAIAVFGAVPGAGAGFVAVWVLDRLWPDEDGA